MNRDVVSLLVCPNCSCQTLDLEVYSVSKGDQVADGRLICLDCSSWFRIENGIVDLLPIKLREANAERFVLKNERFAKQHGLTLTQFETLGRQAILSDKTKPMGAFEDVPEYEATVVNNPYYRALDRIAFHDWMRRNLTDKDLVLDIGCGTGRQCVPLAENGIRTLGLDVDEDMLVLAARKVKEKSLESSVDFVIADGQNPPVKDSVFSACVLYGVLHHLADKRRAIANASAKLAPGGFIYSLDPHKSSARFAFDFLMRIWKLYVEEADEDPLITEKQLYEWMHNARIDGRVQLSTYLPPHIFFADSPVNVLLLSLTDRIFRGLPGIRNIGGVITFEGRKTPEAV